MNTNENKKRPYWIIALVAVIVIVLIVILIPKGKKNEQETVKQPSATTKQEEVVKQEEEETEVETIVEEITTEDVSEIETEEVLSEEEQRQKDKEIWLSQPDNDEICIAIWNDTTNTKNIQILEEKSNSYQYQEGDIIAIPYNENIYAVINRGEEIPTTNTDFGRYYEIEFPKDSEQKEEGFGIHYKTASSTESQFKSIVLVKPE